MMIISYACYYLVLESKQETWSGQKILVTSVRPTILFSRLYGVWVKSWERLGTAVRAIIFSRAGVVDELFFLRLIELKFGRTGMIAFQP